MSTSSEKPHVKNRQKYEALRKKGMSEDQAAELANSDYAGHNAAPSATSQRKRVANRPSPRSSRPEGAKSDDEP